jgi:hypothetical protein
MRTYELNGTSFEANKETVYKIQSKGQKASNGWKTVTQVKGDVVQAYDRFSRSTSGIKRLVAGDKEVARA